MSKNLKDVFSEMKKELEYIIYKNIESFSEGISVIDIEIRFLKNTNIGIDDVLFKTNLNNNGEDKNLSLAKAIIKNTFPENKTICSHAVICMQSVANFVNPLELAYIIKEKLGTEKIVSNLNKKEIVRRRDHVSLLDIRHADPEAIKKAMSWLAERSMILPIKWIKKIKIPEDSLISVKSFDSFINKFEQELLNKKFK